MTTQHRVFIRTCDVRHDALRVMLHQMNKHWQPNPEIVVAAYAKPAWKLPPNVTWHRIGDNKEYPVTRWADATAAFLREVPDEAFTLLLEDYWPTRAVDTRAVQILHDYACQFQYVARIDLTGDRLYAHGVDLTYGSVAHLDLIRSMPGSQYHFSLMAGIWRRDHLLRHLVPGWSPWDCELIGTTALSHDRDVIVLGTRQWPMRHTVALRQGNKNIILDDMHPADIEELTGLGYLKPWGIG